MCQAEGACMADSNVQRNFPRRQHFTCVIKAHCWGNCGVPFDSTKTPLLEAWFPLDFAPSTFPFVGFALCYCKIILITSITMFWDLSPPGSPEPTVGVGDPKHHVFPGLGNIFGKMLQSPSASKHLSLLAGHALAPKWTEISDPVDPWSRLGISLTFRFPEREQEVLWGSECWESAGLKR